LNGFVHPHRHAKDLVDGQRRQVRPVPHRVGGRHRDDETDLRAGVQRTPTRRLGDPASIGARETLVEDVEPQERVIHEEAIDDIDVQVVRASTEDGCRSIKGVADGFIISPHKSGTSDDI